MITGFVIGMTISFLLGVLVASLLRIGVESDAYMYVLREEVYGGTDAYGTQIDVSGRDVHHAI